MGDILPIALVGVCVLAICLDIRFALRPVDPRTFDVVESETSAASQWRLRLRPRCHAGIVIAVVVGLGLGFGGESPMPSIGIPVALLVPASWFSLRREIEIAILRCGDTVRLSRTMRFLGVPVRSEVDTAALGTVNLESIRTFDGSSDALVHRDGSGKNLVLLRYGYSPAWNFPLHRDGLATLADLLRAFFARYASAAGR